MKLVKPMRWKEGMFLRPQHFQQYDLYLESREIGRVQAIEHLSWGLLRIEINETTLDNFTLDISSLRAVLPDGTLIDSPSNSRLMTREFGEQMREPGQQLVASVGVRVAEGRGPQVMGDGSSSADARYMSVEEPAYDLDAGRDAAVIERLDYNLRLFLGDEPVDGYTTLPIVRLESTGDTARPVRIDRSFSPPVLVLAASDALLGSARAVVERQALVLRELAQQRGGSDPDPLILYYGLSGSLPVLRDMVREGQVHPRRMYQELARLAGALLYRDIKRRSADEIPLYDHHEPGPVFERLHELITELSEIAITPGYERIPMTRNVERYAAAIPAELLKTPGCRYFLEIEADESTDRLSMLMMTSKISQDARIQHLRDNALPGVPTEPQSGAPPQLPPGQSGTYFRLKHEDSEWSGQVVPAGELVLFMLNAPQDVKMNLLVIPPAAG